MSYRRHVHVLCQQSNVAHTGRPLAALLMCNPAPCSNAAQEMQPRSPAQTIHAIPRSRCFINRYAAAAHASPRPCTL